MAETSLRNVLATRGWLATVDPGFRDAILAAGRMRKINCGEYVQVAGDERKGLWGLAEGQIGIASAISAPDISFGYIYNVGDWAGYGPLLGTPRVADAVARTPSVILYVRYDTMHRMLADNPGWWREIALLALCDVHRFGDWGSDLLLRNSQARTAAILLHLAGLRRSGEGPATIVVSQSELGEMTNLSRHPIGIILQQFEADGWIASSYRHITLLNVEALRDRASDA